MQASRRRRWLLVSGAVVLGTFAAACGGDGEPGTPAASEPAPVTEPDRTTTTAEALTPEEEVEAAYLRSWEVYAEAVRELDPSGLEDAYAEEALTVVQDEIEELRAAGHSVDVDVDHNIVHVQIVDAERGAIVQDKYVNHMVLVDAATRTPLESDPNDEIFETYQLKEFDGIWKVVAIVRESSSAS